MIFSTRKYTQDVRSSGLANLAHVRPLLEVTAFPQIHHDHLTMPASYFRKSFVDDGIARVFVGVVVGGDKEGLSLGEGAADWDLDDTVVDEWLVFRPSREPIFEVYVG